MSGWLKRLEPETKRAIWGVAWVFLFVFAGKLVGAAKEIAIADRYGVSGTVDVYVLVIGIILWVPTVWTGVMQAVLVPATLSLDVKKRQAFHSELLGVSILLAGIVTCLLIYAAPFVVEVIGTNLGEVQRREAINLVVGLAPLTGGGLIVGVLMAFLLAEERHVNTLLESMPSLGLFLAVLLLGRPDFLSPFIWGNLVGLAVQVFALFWLVSASRVPLRLRFGFKSEVWAIFARRLGLITVSQILLGSMVVVDQIIIVHYQPKGDLAIYNYAMRVVALLLSLGATSVARGTVPVLSRPAMSDSSSLRLAWRWAAGIFFLALIVSAVTWKLSPWLIAVLFERGAFSAKNVVEVSDILRLLLFQVPLYLAWVLLSHEAAAKARYGAIFYATVVAVAIKLIIVFSIVSSFGIQGIALSYLAMYMVLVAVVCLLRAKGGPPNKRGQNGARLPLNESKHV